MEFALVAPLLFAFLFGLLEIGRAIWTKQVIQRATHSTVRCLSIGRTECLTDQGIKDFLIAEAAEGRVRITGANVSSATDVSCGGMDRQNSVTVTVPFDTPVPAILPMLPDQFSATACFPDVSRLSKGSSAPATPPSPTPTPTPSQPSS